MELNTGNGTMGLKCAPCHQYILDEMAASNLSYGKPDGVYWKHLNTLANIQYAAPNKELNFTINPPLFGGAKHNVCQVCHITESDAQAVDGQHTKLTIRVCTDTDCHGDSVTRGTSLAEYYQAGLVGRNLTAANDLHGPWFDEMEKINSSYMSEDGTYYSQGFYVCLGCHTHIGVAFNITRPTSYSFNMTLTGGVADWADVTGIVINESNKNTSISMAIPGSKWG